MIKTFIIVGIMIGIAIVSSIAVILYQGSIANQTISDVTTENVSKKRALKAGDVITLSDGQKAVAFPLIEGFYKDETVLFIHTDASDPSIASMMTMMVNYTTQYSPRIANVSDRALAKVYVFENGVKGANPFGFQSDVFDSIPTDTSYSPLRKIMFVKWNEDVEPRELKSLEEITSTRGNGELTITETNKVVIMPILHWDRTLSDGLKPDSDSDVMMNSSMESMR